MPNVKSTCPEILFFFLLKFDPVIGTACNSILDDSTLKFVREKKKGKMVGIKPKKLIICINCLHHQLSVYLVAN